VTLSETSLPVVDLDDLERAVPLHKRSDDELAELARQLARSLGGRPCGREQAASTTPQPGVSAASFNEDQAQPEVGWAQDSDESIDEVSDDYSLAWAPHTPDAPFAARASQKRSRLSPYVLALAEPLLLAAVGLGLAMVILTERMDELGSNALVINADSAPVQRSQVTAPDVRAPPQSAPGIAGSLAKPDQSYDVATDPGEPSVVTTPAAQSSQMVATDVSPDQVKPAAESSMSGMPQGDSTVSINPDLTGASKGEPEMAPLPPIKPKLLASTDATGRARQRPDAGANAAGNSSFLIQLASSRSKGDALAILSHLKKQFPDVLAGGSIRRADVGGAGVYYRVQAGPLSRDAADKACSQVKASGANCVVVRS
jgi:hypothetical protein